MTVRDFSTYLKDTRLENAHGQDHKSNQLQSILDSERKQDMSIEPVCLVHGSFSCASYHYLQNACS